MDEKEFITTEEKEYIAAMFWARRLKESLKLKEEKKDNEPKYIFYS
jgi:hypothetical protein